MNVSTGIPHSIVSEFFVAYSEDSPVRLRTNQIMAGNKTSWQVSMSARKAAVLRGADGDIQRGQY